MSDTALDPQVIPLPIWPQIGHISKKTSESCAIFFSSSNFPVEFQTCFVSL